METKRNKQVVAKSIRLGWPTRSEQKSQKLSHIVGGGIKVEAGMFCNSIPDTPKWLIP